MSTDLKKPVTVPEHFKIALAAHTALEMLIKGVARRQEWEDLTDVLNIMEALCTLGKITGPVRPYQVGLATEGLVSAMELPDGQMRIEATEQLIALQALVAGYVEAVEKFSRGTLLEAKAEVVRKIAAARAERAGGLIVQG